MFRNLYIEIRYITVQVKVSWCILFGDDIELKGESSEKVNSELEE